MTSQLNLSAHCRCMEDCQPPLSAIVQESNDLQNISCRNALQICTYPSEILKAKRKVWSLQWLNVFQNEGSCVLNGRHRSVPAVALQPRKEDACHTQLEDRIAKASKEEVKWKHGISVLSSMKVCSESLSLSKQGSNWWEPACSLRHVTCDSPCRTSSVPQPLTHRVLLR